MVTALAAPDDKCDAPCFRVLAAHLDLPILPIPADRIETAWTVTQSPRVRAERGTGSVAEAAALAAAGPGARLLAAREISEDRLATCSIAIGNSA